MSKSLAQRIDEALGGRPMTFYALAEKLYPDSRSWRYQSNGGPPGCFMALSSGLRRGGFDVSGNEAGPGNRIVHPRRTANADT